jgi:hypothetical protein
MNKINSVRVTSKARGDLRRLGIPLKEATSMVQKSAVTTHKKGNRRYKGYILSVSKGVLNSVWELRESVGGKGNAKCPVCFGEGEFIVWEECPYCCGEGCSDCNESGTLRKRRRCQCVQKKGFLEKS